MKSSTLLVGAGLLAALVFALIAESGPRNSGFSFTHKGGDCVVWYNRQGNEILDILIAPRSTFGACYSAARRRLRMDDGEVVFGNSHNAYVFDAGQWRTVPLKDLKESDLPSVMELEQCASTGEIVQRILRE
jgi:hypothetical protein